MRLTVLGARTVRSSALTEQSPLSLRGLGMDNCLAGRGYKWNTMRHAVPHLSGHTDDHGALDREIVDPGGFSAPRSPFPLMNILNTQNFEGGL